MVEFSSRSKVRPRKSNSFSKQSFRAISGLTFIVSQSKTSTQLSRFADSPSEDDGPCGPKIRKFLDGPKIRSHIQWEMRFAIFGDIHANLEAFEAVLADAEAEGCDRNICLGDIVGYNADPKACLDKVRELKCPIVKGNHDDYASTLNSLDNFNPLAESAIRWTRDKLSEADKGFLRDLPLVNDVESFTIVHATLDGPGEWGYVLNQLDAAASFSKQKAQVCFFGHTHAPRLYIRDGSVVGLPL